jgi:hypothetical protein
MPVILAALTASGKRYAPRKAEFLIREPQRSNWEAGKAFAIPLWESPFRKKKKPGPSSRLFN